MRNKFLHLIFIFVIAMMLVGCGSKTEDSKKDGGIVQVNPEKIKVAFVTMTTTAPQPLINQVHTICADELERLGVEVEFLPTRSLDNVYPLMDSDTDDPDLVYLPHSAFTTYITETSKFGGSNKYAIIAGSLKLDDIQLIVRPEISSLKELEGKKVGIANLRYSDDYQLNQLLASAGLSTSSVGGTVEVVWDDIVSKLAENYGEGKYDAIVNFNTDNLAGALAKVPGSKVYTLNANIDKKQPRIWLVAKKELIDNNPELVKVFLKAHILSTEKALQEVEQLPALNRDSFLGWFADKGADISEKNPLEKFQKRWEIAEITYDPNMEYIEGVFSFMQQTDVVKGKSLDDFVRINLLTEVLKETGKE